jgi:hypothetical protein
MAWFVQETRGVQYAMKTVVQPPVKRYTESSAQDMTARLPVATRGMRSRIVLLGVDWGTCLSFLEMWRHVWRGPRAMRLVSRPDSWVAGVLDSVLSLMKSIRETKLNREML